MTNNPWTELLKHPQLQPRIDSGEITPLFAVESGSRAWGFASADSDYDVRWIYRHNLDWYLQLGGFRDTLEHKTTFEGIEVDAVGWDLRKYLRLVKKGNAQTFEWVKSCPLYHVNGYFATGVRNYIPTYFNPLQMAYHYRGMYTKHWRRYIEGKDEVTHKKYLYILRALFLTDWYLNNDTMAPATMYDLMSDTLMPTDVAMTTYSLLDAKRAGTELGKAAPNTVLDDYIAERVELWSNGFGIGMSGAPDWTGLNAWFKHCTTTMDNFEQLKQEKPGGN